MPIITLKNKIISFSRMLVWKSWDDVPPTDKCLDSILDPTARLELVSSIKKLLQAIVTNTPMIKPIIVQTRDGFKQEISQQLADTLRLLMGDENIQKVATYLTKSGIATQKETPGIWERIKANTGLLVPVAIGGGIQLVAEFIRQKEGDSPDKTWTFSDPALYHTATFLCFIVFFNKAIELSGLVFKKAAQSSTHPNTPLTTAESVVVINHPATLETLEGSYDITSQRYGPSRLAQAHQGILSISPDMLSDDAMEKLLNLIASIDDTLGLGGKTEHTHPLTSLFAFFEPLHSTQKEDSIYSSSGRIEIHIMIPTVHEDTQEIRHHLIQLVKQTIGNEHTWQDNTLSVILELLSHNKHLIWTPEIRLLIQQISQTAQRTNTPVTPKYLLEEWQKKMTPLRMNAIEQEFRNYQKEKDKGIPPYPHPEKLFLPTSPPTKTIAKPKPSTSIFIENNYTNFIEAQKELLNLNNSEWKDAVVNRKKLEGAEYTLYRETPNKSDPAITENLAISPFATIAGHDSLIKEIIDVLDNHVAQLMQQQSDPTQLTLPKTVIILLTDKESLTKERQYSSGKSTLLKAAEAYLRQAYERAKIKRPHQLLLHGDSGPQYKLSIEKPIGMPPRGLQENVVSTLKRQWPVLSLLLMQDIPFTYLISEISKTFIQDTGDRTEQFAGLVFPWTLYFVNLGLSALLVGGSEYLDRTHHNPYAKLLEDGTALPTAATLSSGLTPDTLLGHAKQTTNPQDALDANKRIELLDLNFRHAILAENWHAFLPQIRETILMMVTNQTAMLGTTIKIPFHVGLLGLTGNDVAGHLQEQAADFCDIRAELTTSIEYPENLEECTKLEQLLLLHLRDYMTIPWSNKHINQLIDKLTQKPGKLFFGIRFIKNFIIDAQKRASIRTGTLADISLDATKRKQQKEKQKTIDPIITDQDFDDAWTTFLIENPHIQSYL